MELKDTISLMQSADFKERFKAEYFQLKIRRSGLKNMLDKWKNGTLEFEPKCPFHLLQKQLLVMDEYLEVLEERAKIEDIKLHGDHLIRDI